MTQVSKPKSCHLMPSEVIQTTPRIGDQDNCGGAKNVIIHVHLFGPLGDWWIAEVDEKGQQAFGFTRLLSFPDGAEWGYIWLPELQEMVDNFVFMKNGTRSMIERDLHWDPKPFSQITT